MTTLVQDNFDRADSAGTVGTPQIGPAPTTRSGIMGINSNRLYAPTAAPGIATWDCGTPNVEVQCALVNSVLGRVAFPLLGWVSNSDYYILTNDPSGTIGAFSIAHVNAGGIKYLASSMCTVPSTPFTVKFSHRNGWLYGYAEGKLLVQAKLDAPITSNHHGVRIQDNLSIRVDDLLITDTPPADPSVPTSTLPPSLPMAADLIDPDTFLYRGRDTKLDDIAGGA